MKKNFKYLTLMATALVLGFSSCSSDDDMTDGGKPAGEIKSLLLKVTSGTPSTYAEDVSESGKAAAFTSGGFIYLLDANSDVVSKIDILSTGVSSPTQITIADLTGAGYEIQNVAANVASVYVVGNVNSGTTTTALNAATSKAMIEAVAFNIGDQASTAVALQGEGAIVATGTAGKSEANVRISPIVARFEISQLEYDDTDASAIGKEIANYIWEGIFVNNSFQDLTLNATRSNLLYKGQSQAGDFTAANFPSQLRDINLTGLGGLATDLTKLPPLGKVWGYTFFPADNSVAATPELPELVLKLTSVNDPTNGYNTKDQFITIKQFVDGQNNVITKFERNKIYKIANIKFTNKHLSEFPSAVSSDVTIKVTIEPWVDVNIDPVMP